MLAVGLGVGEVSPYLENYQDRVTIACYNSPESVTLSGDADAVDELRVYFESQNIFARKLRTGGKAYHSHHMSLASSEYRDMLQSANICCDTKSWKRRQCRMISTVSNSFMGDEMTEYAYWAANLRSPVLFSQAISTLTEEIRCVDLIVEVGPHPALSGSIRQISAHTDRALSYLPTLKRGQNDIDQLLGLVGELWTRHSPVDISAAVRVERVLASGKIEDISGSLLVDLPTYQWNYAKKYISEPRQSREHRGCKHPRHDLLGRRLPGLSLSEPQWRNVLRLEDVPWLKHHIVSTPLTAF
jgi:acyl transferase domain-containing protein